MKGFYRGAIQTPVGLSPFRLCISSSRNTHSRDGQRWGFIRLKYAHVQFLLSARVCDWLREDREPAGASINEFALAASLAGENERRDRIVGILYARSPRDANELLA